MVKLVLQLVLTCNSFHHKFSNVPEASAAVIQPYQRIKFAQLFKRKIIPSLQATTLFEYSFLNHCIFACDHRL